MGIYVFSPCGCCGCCPGTWTSQINVTVHNSAATIPEMGTPAVPCTDCGTSFVLNATADVFVNGLHWGEGWYGTNGTSELGVIKCNGKSQTYNSVTDHGIQFVGTSNGVFASANNLVTYSWTGGTCSFGCAGGTALQIPLGGTYTQTINLDLSDAASANATCVSCIYGGSNTKYVPETLYATPTKNVLYSDPDGNVIQVAFCDNIPANNGGETSITLNRESGLGWFGTYVIQYGFGGGTITDNCQILIDPYPAGGDPRAMKVRMWTGTRNIPVDSVHHSETAFQYTAKLISCNPFEVDIEMSILPFTDHTTYPLANDPTYPAWTHLADSNYIRHISDQQTNVIACGNHGPVILKITE